MCDFRECRNSLKTTGQQDICRLEHAKLRRGEKAVKTLLKEFLIMMADNLKPLIVENFNSSITVTVSTCILPFLEQ